MKKQNHSAPEGVSLRRAALRGVAAALVICALAVTAFAYFNQSASAYVENIRSAVFGAQICAADTGAAVEGEYLCETDGLHSFTVRAVGTASTGYVTVTAGDKSYVTEQLAPGGEITLSVRVKAGTAITFAPGWGTADGAERYGDGAVIAHDPVAGLTISVMGDSISTYTGWSDADPITDESCRFRYGEAYYGPAGGDFHNTDMVVEDTWWHQAATELGAEILRVNSGSSTGLLIASYPANADWDQYLKEMLAYKSRPDYLGRDGREPDIIALYIGSNDVARASVSQMGSMAETDLEALITDNGDGTFAYAEPQTVAEAYCILLHKISVNYPDAEVYCFVAVPNAGGYLSTCNKRLVPVCAFREMVTDVAQYHGAHLVDLMDGFGLDPDGDGVAVQEDWDRFKTYFHEDPHPNAAGFDVITDIFVETVLSCSKYAN